MKKKTGFNLRTICGERIIVAEGKENIDFSNIIALNESAAYLWEKAADNEFTAEDLNKLCGLGICYIGLFSERRCK